MNDRNRFDKFTERSRTVLSLAQEEAQRFNHNFIGTEHLLLGLVREGQGVGAMALKHLGVDLDKARSAVEFRIGRGDRIVLGEIGLTPSAKKVIELAIDEARRLNHQYIGTEHLLLGLVRQGEGIAAEVLESLGVNLEKVRTHTILILSQAGAAHAASQGPALGGAHAPSGRQQHHLLSYQPHHITGEASDKTAIGKKAQQIGIATLLGWVTVNTGGQFTLTLYQGMAADAPKVAVITDPPTGAYFPFHCLLGQGLAYTLTGAPGSVTVVYSDIPAE
ncbi:MAG TPA: Clp protease N-terminal domain-containing protein [Ktedonobacterales bacterium]